MSIDADVSKLFDEPSLWRLEAADALGFEAAELIPVMSPGPAFPAVLRSVEAALTTKPNVIIDLGAGTGGVSEWMRISTGATVYAVDPEDGARTAARCAFPHLRVVEGRADSTSLPGGAADAVVMSGITSLMSHIGPEIAEAKRLLARSGQIAVADLFSATGTSWCAGPNVFRTPDALGRTLHQNGFTVTHVGLGDPVPDQPWAAAAQAVDEWIERHCNHRPGYEEWNADRQHLRLHIEAGHLIGGCVVARRTASDHDCETPSTPAPRRAP